MSFAKPYHAVAIRDCGEALMPIPRDIFAFFDPHPYVALGAPYGNASPWLLRQSVVKALVKAQAILEQKKPGWKIKLFDAYRPKEVQVFMVNRELNMQAHAAGLDPTKLSSAEHEMLMKKVLRLWAMPSDDAATPPPHSTGAAFDCTLVDETEHEVDMGSPIDENSDRSHPDYFGTARDAAEKRAHENRALLNETMLEAGLFRNPTEWWHFSRGDQLSVWAYPHHFPDTIAIYGRAVLP